MPPQAPQGIVFIAAQEFVTTLEGTAHTIGPFNPDLLDVNNILGVGPFLIDSCGLTRRMRTYDAEFAAGVGGAVKVQSAAVVTDPTNWQESSNVGLNEKATVTHAAPSTATQKHVITGATFILSGVITPIKTIQIVDSTSAVLFKSAIGIPVDNDTKQILLPYKVIANAGASVTAEFTAAGGANTLESVFINGFTVDACDQGPISCVGFGQQIIQYGKRFAQNRVDQGNLNVSWSYISPGEEVYMYSGNRATNGGNMDYDNPLQLLEHFRGPYAEGNPPIGHVPKVPVPSPVAPDFGTFNTRPGQSDEPMYASANASGDVFFRVDSNSAINCTPTLGASGIGSWAKDGNELFVAPQGGQGTFRKFNLSGTQLQSNAVNLNVANQFANYISLSTNFVYVLVHVQLPASQAHDFIYKFARSDITILLATLELGDISAGPFYVIDDTLFYIGAMKENSFNADSTRMYVYLNGILEWIGCATPTPGTIHAPNTTFIEDACRVLTFVSGNSEQHYFYTGNGQTAGNSDIYRIGPLTCSDTPLFASVAGPSVGTIGGSVTIAWADILEPTNTISPSQGDYVVLLPAASFFYYDAADHITTQRQYTAGLSSGSMTFTIPNTMLAGSYRIWLGGRNTNIVMAKGNLITLS